MTSTRLDVEATGGDVATVPGIDLGFLLGDEPSAVLLVEMSTERVVHANPVAQQLAPGLSLPSALDAWSDAAELRDPEGGLLSETDHPLSRLTRTEPVTGQAVSARRGSDMGGRRQPLWVLALPLLDAPLLSDHALVVMLPVRLRHEVEGAAHGLDRAGRTALDVHTRAALATGLSFTLADATDPELPLVWVNPAFTAHTGYSLDEALGRNCRFLQGPRTDPASIDLIRSALREGTSVTTTLLNYRKDGAAYWNQLNISPVHGPDGVLTHFVGIQTDVSARVAADQARDAALAAERRARAAAEAAEERLRLLADASSTLSSAVDVADAHRRLAALLVPRLADSATVLGTTTGGRTDVLAAEDGGGDRAVDPARLKAALAAPGATSVVDAVLGPDGERLVRDLRADQEVLGAVVSPTTRSVLVVPLPGRSSTAEVLVLGRGPERDQFTVTDLELARDLGQRAGLLVENTRLYELQRANSEVLQRSLLPELPAIKSVLSAASYHAGAVGSQVGGDFYDLAELSDGTVALCIGDVVGHDMWAAAAMGQLRGLLRACVRDDDASPARVLERIERLLRDLQITTMATILQAFMTRTADGWDVSWSSGGHPALVVRRPDGRTHLLGDIYRDSDPMLGLDTSTRREHHATLPVGSLVVGYTDGLVERRREPLDRGLERLIERVETGPDQPALLVEHLIDGLTRGSDHDDDVVVLAVLLR